MVGVAVNYFIEPFIVFVAVVVVYCCYIATLLHDLILNQYLSVMISSSDPFRENSCMNMNAEDVMTVYIDTN